MSTNSPENRRAFVRGESFFDYIERTNDLKTGDTIGNRLRRIGEVASFGQLLEYMWWQKQEFSASSNSRDLLSFLPHILLQEGKSTYPCMISSFDGKETTIDVEHRPAIEHVLPLHNASKESFSQLAPLSDFIVPRIISGLEDQVINGGGGEEQMNGLLAQAETADLQEDWKKMCEDAVIKFCERKRSAPTALIMHPRIMPRFMIAMKAESESVASLAFKPFLSYFMGIPIVSSCSIPDENTLLLANLEGVFVFSKPNIKLERKELEGGNSVTFTHWTNLAFKDRESATMKITLPKSDS